MLTKPYNMAVRAISSILVAALLFSDVVWANPDALQIELRTGKQYFREPFIFTYDLRAASDVLTAIDHLSVPSLESIAAWAGSRPLQTTRMSVATICDEITGKPQEILIRAGEGGNIIIRYGDKLPQNIPHDFLSFDAMQGTSDDTPCSSILISNKLYAAIKDGTLKIPEDNLIRSFIVKASTTDGGLRHESISTEQPVVRSKRFYRYFNFILSRFALYILLFIFSSPLSMVVAQTVTDNAGNGASIITEVTPMPDPIEVYAKELKSDSNEEAFAAAERLASLKGPHVVDVLINELDAAKDPARIGMLAQALAVSHDTRALNGLMQRCEAIISSNYSNKNQLIPFFVDAVVSFKSERSTFFLINILNDEDREPNTRVVAAKGLGAINNEAAIDALIDALIKNEIRLIKEVITKELTHIGKIAADKLIDAANDPVVSDREKRLYKQALEAMGNGDVVNKILDSKAEQVALDIVIDDAAEKSVSIKNLIEAKRWGALVDRGRGAVMPLVDCLENEDVQVRFGAAWALGRIRDTRAIEPLIKLFDDEFKTVQEGAIDALVSIGTPAADVWLSKFSFWRVGPARGIEVLARLKDPRTYKVIVENLKPNHRNYNNEYFAAYARGAGVYGNPDAIKLLLDNAGQQSGEERLASIRSIGQLGGRGAVGTLVKDFLSHEEADVRRVTAEALDKCGWKPATDAEKIQYYIATHNWQGLIRAKTAEPLAAYLKDKDIETRLGAGYAMLTIAKNTALTRPLNRVILDMRSGSLTPAEKNLVLESVTLLGHLAGSREDIDTFLRVKKENFKYHKLIRLKAEDALHETRGRIGEKEWNRLTEIDWNKARHYADRARKWATYVGVLYAAFAALSYMGSLIFGVAGWIKRSIRHRNDKGIDADKVAPLLIKQPPSFFAPISAYISSSLKFNGEEFIKNKIGSPGSHSFDEKFLIAALMDLLFVIGALTGAYAGWMSSWRELFSVFGLLVLTFHLFFPITGVGLFYSSRVVKAVYFIGSVIAYPIQYLKFAKDYFSSGAISIRHYHIMQAIGNMSAARRIFDGLGEKIMEKFGPTKYRKAFYKAIGLTSELMKEGKDARDLLEIQIPTALELSTDFDNFMANLELITKLLRGKHDIQLFKDKNAFRNFFLASSQTLKPLDAERLSEMIGLLEDRLSQNGFSIPHFYNEVFGGLDKDIVTGSYGIIYGLVRNGIYPTAKLIALSKERENGERENFYNQLRAIAQDIRSGAFDIDNPLHAELEYSTFRRIIDTSRIVSSEFGKFWYKDYRGYLKRQRKAAPHDEDPAVRSELVYAAHEALKLREFLNNVMERSYTNQRPVWVIPNFSLGRFASVFIEGSLWASGAETVFAKIGSSETHENPYYVDPKFIRSHILRRMIAEKPTIVVIDSSQHIDRYPDAYQGYLNLVIALNDVIANGNIAEYVDSVGRDEKFIGDLRNSKSFQALRAVIEKEYSALTHKDDRLFEFHFWNPRGAKLKTRSSWKTRRGTIDKPEPVDINAVTGPALIFVNSVMLDEDMPADIKKAANDSRHAPGYFDDIDYLRIASLLFKFDAQGVHLADRMHELEMRAIELLDPQTRRLAAPIAERAPQTDAVNGIAVTKERELFEERSKLRMQRLLDELENKNPKIRSDAAADLGEYAGNNVVASALSKALRNNKKFEEVRYWIVISLGVIGIIESESALVYALAADPSFDVQAEAARSLGKLKAISAIPYLEKALLGKNVEMAVAREILFALRSIRSKDALSALLRAIETKTDPFLRAIALEAYLDVGRYDVVEAALLYRSDPQEKVRLVLFEGLGDLGETLADKRSIVEAALMGCLQKEEAAPVREKIAWALGQIGTGGALAIIDDAIGKENNGDVIDMLRFAKENIEHRLNHLPSKNITIISGGQTGADRGALEGAREAGVATGGTMPRGYMTEYGADSALKEFGLKESLSFHFDDRTGENVRDADVTIVFGDITSPGSKLTIEHATRQGKPIFINPTVSEGQMLLRFFRTFNIAGNRESVNPGIGKQVHDWVVQVFSVPAIQAAKGPDAPQILQPVIDDEAVYKKIIENAADRKIFVIDLDRTLALLGKPITITVACQLMRLLENEKKIVIVTGAKNTDMGWRIWLRISEKLRKNLFISAEMDGVGYGFNEAGNTVPGYDHSLSAGDYQAIQDAAESVLGSRKTEKETPHKVRILLPKKKGAELRKLIGTFEAELTKRAGHLSVYWSKTDGFVVVASSNKVKAVRSALDMWGMPEKDLVIIGDEARSYGIDRGILTIFHEALSINVGSTSPTIQALNPSIIQTTVKNTEAVARMLSDITATLSRHKQDRIAVADASEMAEQPSRAPPPAIDHEMSPLPPVFADQDHLDQYLNGASQTGDIKALCNAWGEALDNSHHTTDPEGALRGRAREYIAQLGGLHPQMLLVMTNSVSSESGFVNKVTSEVLGRPAPEESTGQCLILYADDIMKNGIVDIETTLKESTALKDATVFVYGRQEEYAALLKEMIEKVNSSIKVIVVSFAELDDRYQVGYSEGKELDAIIRLALARGIKKSTILGVIKGAIDEMAINEVSDVSRQQKIPVVSFETADGIYSFGSALIALLRIRAFDNKDIQYFVRLPPIERLTEEIQKRYKRYRLLLDVATKA